MPTILITGASRGLGLEFARQYAAEDWRVHACCRAPDEATDLAALAKANGAVTVHRLDVRARTEARALADALDGAPLDVLLNNAGVMGPKPQAFGDCDDKAWAEMLDTNVVGPMRLAEELVDNVAAGERKVIAALSSRMGSVGANQSGGYYLYRSSKAALNAVVKSLAIDLAGRGIVCVAFHPGWVSTDMGGKSAPLAPAESVAALRKVIAGLGPGDSGRFINYDGTDLPW